MTDLFKEHFAIISTSRIYVPGDERSRTNPGHGYPEHYEDTIQYEAFDSEEKLKAGILRKEKYGNNFRVIRAIPISHEQKIEISLK